MSVKRELTVLPLKRLESCRVAFNKPFPSSKISFFQTNAKCKTFLVKMTFYLLGNKNSFSYQQTFALSLSLAQRLEAIQKLPYCFCFWDVSLLIQVFFFLYLSLLPHSLYSDDVEVCLFTKEESSKAKEMLKAKGVNVKKVILIINIFTNF